MYFPQIFLNFFLTRTRRKRDKSKIKNFFLMVTSVSTPPPLPHCHQFVRPLSPWPGDVIFEWPLKCSWDTSKSLVWLFFCRPQTPCLSANDRKLFSHILIFVWLLVFTCISKLMSHRNSTFPMISRYITLSIFIFNLCQFSGFYDWSSRKVRTGQTTNGLTMFDKQRQPLKVGAGLKWGWGVSLSMVF